MIGHKLAPIVITACLYDAKFSGVLVVAAATVLLAGLYLSSADAARVQGFSGDFLRGVTGCHGLTSCSGLRVGMYISTSTACDGFKNV